LKAVEFHEIQLTLLKVKSELNLYKTLSYSLIVVVIVEAALIGYMVRRRS